MATKAADEPTSLICTLCEKTYQHKDGPFMLPCLHSFCKPCLAQYIKKEQSADKMACPTCNTRFARSNDINHFPLNLRLSNLAKSSKYEKQAEGGNVKCQNCEGTPKDATFFFCNRSKFLCSTCKGYCQRLLDEDDDLEFIDLAKFEKGAFKIHSPFPKCPEHKEKLILFCEECSQLICLACAQTKHQDHKKSSLGEKSKDEKKGLQKQMDDVNVDGALDTMDQTLQQIQQTRDKVKVSAEEATERINKACDDLIQAVENRRKLLLKKCREIAEEKDDTLSNQTLGIERLRKELGFAQLHAKDAINNHSPEEILSVKKIIQCQLDSTMETYRQQTMELTENATINTSLQIEPLVEEMQKFGFFPNIPDPPKCHVEELAIPAAIVGKERKVTVVLKDEMDKPIEGDACFQYQLRKVGDDLEECIAPKVNITRSNGTATLVFTPDQPGEYELTIMVRNRPIANPYKITVRQPRDYRNLNNMQVTYKAVGGQCYGVAVHDNGTVYATDYSNNTIKVFRPDGTEGQIGGPDNAGGGLSGAWGITLLNNTLYVVGRNNHMVKKYSIDDGRFIGGFGGNGSGNGQFSYPLGICTDGRGRLLVVDQCNNRIQVFTSEGNFISSFQCSTNPYDVAVDPAGNIHVAVYDNNHIAVYSQDGRQIETYNLGGNVRGPTGIYIDGEGNRLMGANDQVHIADPTGTLISTRQVNGVWGVTMDKNGVIHVAEYNNSRVSVYY